MSLQTGTKPSVYTLLRKFLIQLLGNITKCLCYIQVFFCPKKRFTFRPNIPARKKAAYEQKIPRIIWQTNFTNKITLPVYLNYLFNKWMSPTYEYRFVSTEERDAFVKANFPPQVYDCYSRLQIGAAQADFWRVLVLQKYGGIYMDINATLIYSPDKFIAPQDTDIYLRYKDRDGKGMSNFFICSAKDNPDLEKIINQITQNIEQNTSNNVYDLTGPGVFNTALDMNRIKTVSYKESCFKAAFTNEFFQYIDKPQGKWHKEAKTKPVVRPR